MEVARSLAESELGILSSQCLDRRIPDKHTLIDEIALGSTSAMPTTQRPIGTSQHPMPVSTHASIPFN